MIRFKIYNHVKIQRPCIMTWDLPRCMLFCIRVNTQTNWATIYTGFCLSQYSIAASLENIFLRGYCWIFGQKTLNICNISNEKTPLTMTLLKYFLVLKSADTCEKSLWIRLWKNPGWLFSLFFCNRENCCNVMWYFKVF